jgi:hypothetical protein
MAFKEVTVGEGINYIRPKALAEAGTTGVILEGEYLGTVMNPKSQNNDFKFKTADGISVINRAGSLAIRMEQIQPGTLCQVVYNGQAEITKGTHKGVLAHQFNVLVEDGE